MKNLKDFIAIYDDVLPVSLCDQMIQQFETLRTHQVRNGAGVREGLDQSGWTEMDITPLSDLSLKQMIQEAVLKHFALYNEGLGLSVPITPLHKLSELRIKRYGAEQNDRFQVHFDSIRELSNRYLVFLWYLNDVDEGGETSFPDIGVKVSARRGRLLVFPPYWMFQHEGLPPLYGNKYIISTYALY